MGFRSGAFAKVWEVKPLSDSRTDLRVSVSRKNKETGEYEQDFSGFVEAIGSAAARKAAGLKKGDRIKLGDVDVSTRYVKEKDTTYTNFKLFSFDKEGESDPGQSRTPVTPPVDEGEPDEPDHNLPF